MLGWTVLDRCPGDGNVPTGKNVQTGVNVQGMAVKKERVPWKPESGLTDGTCHFHQNTVPGCLKRTAIKNTRRKPGPECRRPRLWKTIPDGIPKPSITDGRAHGFAPESGSATVTGAGCAVSVKKNVCADSTPIIWTGTERIIIPAI